MAAIAGGCDAFSVPSAPAVASTDCAQLSWTGQGSFSGNMSFYMGYVSVVSDTDIANMNAAGVSVCLFMENTLHIGPQGSLGYTPVDPQYFTFAQGAFDAAWARDPSNIGSTWPLNRPIYYTVDFASNASNLGAISAYLNGVLSIDQVVGLYANGGTCKNVITTGGSVSYYWQNESLGEYDNSTLWASSSGWQVFNGGHLSLSNGDTAIDGDFAFQSNITSTGDFGQYPFGTPEVGILTYATVTNPTTTFTQPELQTIIVPKYNYDHVIFSDTIELSVSGSVWPQTLDGPATSINQTAYPMGNFSFDNGQTWQDFGFIEANDYGSSYGELPKWVIQPVVDSLGNITFNVSFPAGGSASANFIIHITLLASYSPSELASTYVTQQTAFSNLVPNITPPYATYRRISTDTAVIGGTYAHGLGTIPNLLFWQYDTSNDTDIAPSRWSSSGGIGGELGVAMDFTNVYIHLDSSTQDVFLREYYDN